MSDDKPKRKVIMVRLHSHEWPVYPCQARGSISYKVPYRSGGVRKFKSFSDLTKAKKDAKTLLYAAFGGIRTEVHLTEDERHDAQAAMNNLRAAGIRASLETITRHYCDLAKVVGGESLLTDVAQKYAASRGQTCLPVTLESLKDSYVSTMKSEGRSKRYVEILKSNCGKFVREVGPELKSNQVTREIIQKFLDDRNVGPRAKLNFAEAIRTMFLFAKSKRRVPAEWNEIAHVTLPLVKHGKIPTFTPEELKKLLAATPHEFIPCMVLSAFAGMRSSEVERTSFTWANIRLKAEKAEDRIINLDAHVTKTNSRRTVPIHETLAEWLAPHRKPFGQVYTKSHSRFYQRQQEIAKAAGVKWRQNALRHTCISAKVALSRDVPRVAYESGNSVAMIKKHYLDLMEPSVAAEWFSVTPAVVAAYKNEIAASAEKPHPAKGKAV